MPCKLGQGGQKSKQVALRGFSLRSGLYFGVTRGLANVQNEGCFFLMFYACAHDGKNMNRREEQDRDGDSRTRLR